MTQFNKVKYDAKGLSKLAMLEKKIADRIRHIRKNKGLTLAQLGENVGLSKGLLSRIENNQVSPPIATLSKIARDLEVAISIFFEE